MPGCIKLSPPLLFQTVIPTIGSVETDKATYKPHVMEIWLSKARHHGTQNTGGHRHFACISFPTSATQWVVAPIVAMVDNLGGKD